MTDHTAIIELLERQLDRHVEQMRDAAKTVSELRRRLDLAEATIAAGSDAVDELRTRCDAMRAVLGEIRALAEDCIDGEDMGTEAHRLSWARVTNWIRGAMTIRKGEN
jgi:uncharacterized coiled-coil DUF342 family protein